MAKKLFKKKSFWAKLPARSKVGIIVLGLMLFGAAAAFALSQQDSSLQSKASLSCSSSCVTACQQISDVTQRAKCISECNQKCANQQAELPQACRHVDRYVAVMERRNGLTGYQLSIVKRVLLRTGENIDKSKALTNDNFVEWFKDRCIPDRACDRYWTQVATSGSTSSPNQNGVPSYYWTTTCKGYDPLAGRDCQQAQVRLTPDEVVAYQRWVDAGRPEVTQACRTTQDEPQTRRPTGPDPMPTTMPIPGGSGCYYQKVVCVTTPCDPVLVCPNQPTNPSIPTTSPAPRETVVPTNSPTSNTSYCGRDWNQVMSYMDGYAWPNSCKGSLTGRNTMCSQVITPLTSAEVDVYLAWVNAGKPAPTACR